MDAAIKADAFSVPGFTVLQSSFVSVDLVTQKLSEQQYQGDHNQQMTTPNTRAVPMLAVDNHAWMGRNGRRHNRLPVFISFNAAINNDWYQLTRGVPKKYRQNRGESEERPER